MRHNGDIIRAKPVLPEAGDAVESQSYGRNRHNGAYYKQLIEHEKKRSAAIEELNRRKTVPLDNIIVEELIEIVTNQGPILSKEIGGLMNINVALVCKIGDSLVRRGRFSKAHRSPKSKGYDLNDSWVSESQES